VKNIFLTKRRSFWTWQERNEERREEPMKKDVKNHMKKDGRKEDMKKGEDSETPEE
jgi:hypothetical protein